jgi:hypothetical protein
LGGSAPTYCSASAIQRRGAWARKRLALQRLADAEHVAPDLHAADHVAVEHPAVAAEHLLLPDVAAPGEGAAQTFGQVRVMRHGGAPSVGAGQG